MKRIFYLAFAAVFALSALFISCDNFNKDELLIGVVGETLESSPITNTASVQRVLLEDYTGWRCNNCPEAAVVAEDLKVQYGNVLVLMSVHATAFAQPLALNNFLDLRTEYGERWAKEFDANALPAGLVNRVKENGAFKIAYEDWAAKVAQRKNRPHVLDINLGASVNQDNKIIVSTENIFLQSVDFPTLINVLVLESDIRGVQLTNPPTPDYQFNNVVRTNGRVDFALTTEPARAGETISKNYFINISQDWNLANCKVVVFVTNANTKEVIQVNEVDLQ
ncbi:MAG: Omp28-related outer membrane protein [Bacteroidales bacterium]|jgi:hypothetical protein|nr:Omp28-related outer membrane protein [Bacteroidales bacterium]